MSAVTAFFTRHAGIRIYQRLSMSHVEVAELLNNDRAVNIGVDRARRLVHRLFFSERDRKCFVAVQSEKDGSVITVWPINYHQRLAWCVSADARRIAIALATGVALPPVEADRLVRYVRNVPKLPPHEAMRRARAYRRACASRRCRSPEPSAADDCESAA